MTKRLIVLAMAAFLLLGCSEQVEPTATTDVTLDQLVSSTGDYVSKTIRVSGTVDHVCKHGGKKMFIVGADPSQRFKITASNAIGSFDVALEGSDVTVVAVVEEQRVDEAYLTNWEQELAEQEGAELAEEEHHEGEHAGDEHAPKRDEAKEKSSAQKNIDQLREQVCESETGYLSFYSAEGLSFQVQS